jgi:hypothetical protein
LTCHKAHDPQQLCAKVKDSLLQGDLNVLNENQQHTLHIAMVEETVSEDEMVRKRLRTVFHYMN